jgi:hypothetical protein
MGQGHYIKIVFGQTGEPEGWDRDACTDPYREQPDSAYESNVPWYGFTIAGGQGTAGRDEFELEYFAVDLADLPKYLDERAPEAVANAKARWQAWREKHPEFGEGRLLFVADYD